MNLHEFGELNQSQLMSYCGLNNVQHKPIIDELVEKGLITRFEEPWGEQNKIIKYKVSEKGREIARAIFEPYELLFPGARRGNEDSKYSNCRLRNAVERINWWLT